MDEAIAFYRSTEKNSRLLSCMRNKFRFIKTEYHLKKLRQIEREGRSHTRNQFHIAGLFQAFILRLFPGKLGADRKLRLRLLADKVEEEVRSKFSTGISLHDRDIRQIALRINKEETLVENFKGSHRWIQEFKKSCGIVSRHITTFASRRSFLERDRIVADAEKFVLDVKKGRKLYSSLL